MAKFIFRLIFYLLFWIGGWVGLRSLPQGLELLNRQLFLETQKYKYIFIIGLAVWIAIFITLLVYKHSFGRLNIFKFEPDKLNVFLLLITGTLLIANFVAIFFIREKNLSGLTICLVGVTFYYFSDTLFQQIINFGFLQEGFSKIVSPAVTVLGVSAFFAASHFLAMLEGAKFSEVLGLVVMAFFLGLIFGGLRLKYGSIIPGFLIHFGIYLFWNGPLLLLLQKGI